MLESAGLNVIEILTIGCVAGGRPSLKRIKSLVYSCQWLKSIATSLVYNSPRGTSKRYRSQ